MARGKAARVEGLRNLQRKLKGLERNTAGRALDGAVLAGAEPIKDEMAYRAPRSDIAGGTYGTGHAADNIVTEITSESFVGRISEAGIGPDKEHWYIIFSELGTAHSPANPFMRQALVSAHDEAVVKLSGELRRRIMEATR